MMPAPPQSLCMRRGGGLSRDADSSVNRFPLTVALSLSLLQTHCVWMAKGKPVAQSSQVSCLGRWKLALPSCSDHILRVPSAPVCVLWMCHTSDLLPAPRTYSSCPPALILPKALIPRESNRTLAIIPSTSGNASSPAIHAAQPLCSPLQPNSLNLIPSLPPPAPAL